MTKSDKDRYVYFRGRPAKKTFGDKLKSAFKKTMLITLAGTGIAGYHTYGTGEDVVATVTAVEQANVGAGETPYTIIHTDQGTFINTQTVLHLKDASDTQAINSRAQVGAKLSFRVYGLNPTVGSFGPHTFGVHRNIIRVGDAPAGLSTPVRQPAAPQPAAAPAAPVAPTPQQPEAGLRTVLGVAAGSDLNAPQTCVDTEQLGRMREQNPQIYRDLAFMERLPLTGKPVFDVVTLRDNEIRACLTPYNRNSGVSGTFFNNTVRIMRGVSSATTLHEYYHALQSLNDDVDNAHSKLTLKDFAIATALQEATSVGYSLMVEREALSRGITLSPSTHGDNFVGAHDNAGTRAVFDRAYDAAYAANSSLPAQQREAAALQAGAQEVVRTLMLGDDTDWLSGYSRMIVSNMNANTQVLSRNTDTASDYVATRNTVFTRMGRISDSINIVPQEFTGSDAARHINRTYSLLGIRTTPASAALRSRAPGA